MTYTNTYAGADGVVLLAKDADDQFDLIETEFAARPLNAAPGPIGSGTPSTGAFTTLSASGTVSGAGITARFSAPGPIGDGTPSTGAFTTLSASGAVSGAGFTSRFSAPGPIGDVTPSTGAFTTLAADSGAFTDLASTVSANGVAGPTATNTNAGAGAVAAYSAYNDGGFFSFIGITSSNCALSDLFGPNYGAIFSLGKLSVTTSSTEIFFGISGTSLVATINTLGITANLGYTFNAYAASGAPFSMGGKLHVNTTQVGNVGAGTDDLMTYNLPADVLGSNGKGVRIKAWGTLANNGNTKTVTLLFGSQTLITKALAGAYGEVYSWEIEAVVLRTGSNTQTNFTKLAYTGTVAGGTIPLTGVGNLTQADTGAIVIKCTGAATADNDIVQTGMIIEFIN